MYKSHSSFFESDAQDIPAAVGIDTAQKKGHIQRLYDEEPDLNTVIFKNADYANSIS